MTHHHSNTIYFTPSLLFRWKSTNFSLWSLPRCTSQLYWFQLVCISLGSTMWIINYLCDSNPWCHTFLHLGASTTTTSALLLVSRSPLLHFVMSGLQYGFLVTGYLRIAALSVTTYEWGQCFIPRDLVTNFLYPGILQHCRWCGESTRSIGRTEG